MTRDFATILDRWKAIDRQLQAGVNKTSVVASADCLINCSPEGWAVSVLYDVGYTVFTTKQMSRLKKLLQDPRLVGYLQQQPV